MAQVKFIRRETEQELQDVSIEDGQFLVSGEGTSYVDYNDNRVPLGDKATISQLRTALGLNNDTFIVGKAYDVGDMIIYNHTIYECNVPHIAEEFEREKWNIVPIIVNN